MKKYLMVFAMAGLMLSFSTPALFANNSVDTEMSTEKKEKKKKKKKSCSEKKECSGKEGGSGGCCHGAKKSS